MRRSLQLVLPILLIATAACYHATITTGLTPSPQTIEKQWASGWLWGLVGPSPVSTMAKCPAGVAKVETEHSFLNMLVQWLTSGIYSPMTISVTCATGHAALPAGASEIHANPADLQRALDSAAVLARGGRGPVFIRY